MARLLRQMQPLTRQPGRVLFDLAYQACLGHYLNPRSRNQKPSAASAQFLIKVVDEFVVF